MTSKQLKEEICEEQEERKGLPSPLALLAATCSKIGEEQRISEESDSSEGNVATQAERDPLSLSPQSQQPQVITLQQFQNLLTLQQVNGNEQKYVQAAASPTVSVQGVPGQYIQSGGGGGGVTYSVLQGSQGGGMQAITVDGQEAVFIPSSTGLVSPLRVLPAGVLPTGAPLTPTTLFPVQKVGPFYGGSFAYLDSVCSQKSVSEWLKSVTFRYEVKGSFRCTSAAITELIIHYPTDL
ncbi:unnamed protein product [Nezara viridula]|uniref:Uncharacterized protein n=1 Tax=Nezara viridula TaxID=85310 RepID=A0A9P0DZY4_NEZVI|nr:unnamed protein product [Nezara viridula]